MSRISKEENVRRADGWVAWALRSGRLTAETAPGWRERILAEGTTATTQLQAMPVRRQTTAGSAVLSTASGIAPHAVAGVKSEIARRLIADEPSQAKAHALLSACLGLSEERATSRALNWKRRQERFR